MGEDVWGGERSRQQYLDECRSSEKYKRGQWYVCEDGGKIVCSLIVYEFRSDAFGIGSVATVPLHRGQGHASTLIRWVTDHLQARSPFLYADIDRGFYQRLGFTPVPRSTCMVLGELGDFIPDYF